METEKITPKFPVESATSRDILATFSSEHALHSMDGATAAAGAITLICSCGAEVPVTATDAEAVGWKLHDVKERLSLKKLGQIGRVR